MEGEAEIIFKGDYQGPIKPNLVYFGSEISKKI
jgi:hypothetical protein